MKKTILALSVSALLGISMQANANGASYVAPQHKNSFLSHILVRVRALDIAPQVSDHPISGIGGNVTNVSNQIIPELDISYFFTKHISAELILGTSKHSVTATDTAAGTVPLGTVRLLPPTLVLQYHFLPGRMIDPYIGAGINYTYFYGAKSGSVATSIHYDNSFGPAFDVGADVALKNNWFLNVDIKKVYIESKVTVGVPGALGVGPTVDTKVKINPWLYGVGLGYRFR